MTGRLAGLGPSLAVVSAALALGVAGCTRLPIEAARRAAAITCAGVTGTWVLASNSALLGSRVLVLAAKRGSTAPDSEIASPDASGSWGTALDPASVVATPGCGTFTVEAVLATPGTGVRLEMNVVGDTAQGVGLGGGTTAPVFGLRVNPSLLIRSDSQDLSTSADDSTPAVLLRMDDVMTTDRAFLPHLTARGLVGELAVPTELVGRAGFLMWPEIARWHAAGFGIAAHSRMHSAQTAPDLAFMAEVIGSLADLRAQGLSTDAFVQPGVWTDSIYFNSPSKMQNWRGALLRSFVRVFEAYATGPAVPTGALREVPMGIGHTTVSDGNSPSYDLRAWRSVGLPGHFTILLIHSRTLATPDALDYLLDSIKAARDAGRLRVASRSDQFLR